MTVRWGIAAPGRIAAQFAEGLALVDDAELVAVGSRAKERADAFGDRFEIPNRYGSYDELMEDPDVDAVYVATPHAASCGRHVAVPLRRQARALREAVRAQRDAGERMIAAAEAQRRFLMEAMWSSLPPVVPSAA